MAAPLFAKTWKTPAISSPLQPSSPGSSLADQKKALRARLQAVREAASAAWADTGSEAGFEPGAAAAQNFLDHIDPGEGSIVAVYWPIRHELDTKPLLQSLDALGVAAALPVVIAKKAPLEFRLFGPGDRLADNVHGVMAPAETADRVDPDIIVTPLLGFTAKGDRLGYGGGYYDRTLAALRKARQVLAVGYAYSAQRVDALPVTKLDQRLDWIVTEKQAIRV